MAISTVRIARHQFEHRCAHRFALYHLSPTSLSLKEREAFVRSSLIFLKETSDREGVLTARVVNGEVESLVLLPRLEMDLVASLIGQFEDGLDRVDKHV